VATSGFRRSCSVALIMASGWRDATRAATRIALPGGVEARRTTARAGWRCAYRAGLVVPAQPDGADVVATLGEAGGEPVPAPWAVPGAMDEQDPSHGLSR
jgi:hypothetical protein